MALGKREDPIAGFRYGVELQGLVVGWFTECGGLSVERGVVPYEEGGVNDFVHQLPGPLKRTQITLKRGLADAALWDWFQKGIYDGAVVRRNVSIVLYGTDRQEARRWDLADVYPTKWTGVEFKAGDGQVVVEALELGQGASDADAALVQRRVVEAGSAGAVGLGQAAGPDALPEAIDRRALAQRVYDLLKRESRWERERLGQRR
jgi:phage tail-like protein